MHSAYDLVAEWQHSKAASLCTDPQVSPDAQMSTLLPSEGHLSLEPGGPRAAMLQLDGGIWCLSSAQVSRHITAECHARVQVLRPPCRD